MSTRRRLAVRLAGAALLGGGCGGAPSATPDAGASDAAAQDAGPTWWQPRPGEAQDWDIQLAEPIDTSAARTMYVLDLWSLVPEATALDHGDGAPVAVPAGALAGTLAELHARTPTTIVVCRVATGTWEAARPDAGKFPGAEEAPPDRPTAPADGSAIGWSTGIPGERALDLREASRPAFEALIWARLDLARAIGCDGVLADGNDVVTADPGFPISVAEQGAWFRAVAAQAHARDLAVGMKDGNTIPGFVDDLAPDFDWLTIQRCAEYQDCDSARPFVNLSKAVLAIDYELDGDGGGVDPAIACPRQRVAMIRDGLVKDVALSAADRHPCGE